VTLEYTVYVLMSIAICVFICVLYVLIVS